MLIVSDRGVREGNGGRVGLERDKDSGRETDKPQRKTPVCCVHIYIPFSQLNAFDLLFGQI